MTQSKGQISISQRITVLDSLRGFTLLGIIIVHMLQHFGYLSPTLSEEQNLHLSLWDIAVRWIAQNFISGRFVNIFAFLFGLSFFIQMDRADRKGIDFRKRFIWRMVILFLIGILGTCFYGDDILPVYALLGVMVVTLYKVKSSILLVFVSILLLGGPRYALVQINEKNTVEKSIVKKNKIDQFVVDSDEKIDASALNVDLYDRNGSFIDTVKVNLQEKIVRKFTSQFGVLGKGYVTMALFILGLIVGRIRFFERIESSKKKNLTIFFLFSLLYLLATFGEYMFSSSKLTYLEQLDISNVVFTSSTFLYMMLHDLSTVLFSGVLVLGFILLYHTKMLGKYLDILSFYGRMGLTNYEMQGIIGALLFAPWAFGYYFEHWMAFEVFLLALVVYVAQLIISKYWLKYFIYGPYEWMWRSLTYLKRQPFLKK